MNTYSDIICSNGFSPPPNTIGNRTSCSESRTTLKYLEQITYNDVTIDFNLGLREDLASTAPSTSTNIELMPKKLNGIHIKYKGDTAKKIDLVTSYFNSNKLNDQLKTRFVRLKLDKVVVNDLDEYSFTYHSPENLPSKISKGVDFWGFYNGKNNNNFRYPDFEFTFNCNLGTPTGASINGGDRNANFNYGKNGLLSKITYPTKGYSEFFYEPNVVKSANSNSGYEDPDHNSYGMGSHDERQGEVTRTIVLTGNANLTGELTIICSSNFVSGGVSVCDFNDSAIRQYGSHKAFEIIDASTGENIPHYTRLYSTYNNSGEEYRQQINMNLSAGTYYIKTKAIKFPGYQLRSPDERYFSFATIFSMDIPISLDGNNNGNSNSNYRNREVGGGRIKSIISYGSDQTPLLRKDYEYLEQNGDFSSGVLINPIKFEDFFIVTPPTTYHQNSVGVEVSSVPNSVTSSMFALGSHVGYSRVEEISTNTGSVGTNNGKKRMTFKNLPGTFYHYLKNQAYHNATTDENSIEYFGIVNNNFENGDIIFEEFLDSNDSIVKSINYRYSTYDLNIGFNRGGIAYVKPRPNLTSELTNFIHFGYMSKVKLLSQKRIRDYFRDGSDTNFVETITKYKYNNPNFLLTDQTVTNSEGKTYISKTFYADNVTSTNSLGEALTIQEKSAIDSLKRENLHRVGEPIQVDLYEDLNGDNVADNNELLTRQRTNYRDWGLNSLATGNLILPEFTQTSKSPNSLEDRITYHNYNDFGNPLEVSRSNGAHVYYIWGYNDQYPIAKVEHFKSSDITTTVQTLIDDTIAASNADNDRTIDTINTNGTTTYTGNEGALRRALTNLRNDPLLANAQMTTYTYDPLVGVTSITDPKGYTTTYHYDSANRLEAIRDADGNLVEDYTYHYKNQQ